ncbi:MAG: hypothetical protein AB8B50_01520 [Pirellulaceae bacterium]
MASKLAFFIDTDGVGVFVRRRCFEFVCLAALLLVGQQTLLAEDDVQKKTRTEATKKLTSGEKTSHEKKSVEETLATLAFVGEHQPRLLKLMKYLERKQPAQYQQALREMGRSKTRLESLKKRDEEMYSIELELWQLRSEQRLVAAELATQEKPARLKAGEEELEQLIVRESKKNLERLDLLHQKAQSQVQRLELQIEKSEANQASWVQKQLKTWGNRIQKQAAQSSAANREQRSKTKASKKAKRDNNPAGQ